MAFLDDPDEPFGGFVPSNAYYFMNTTTASPPTATIVSDPTCLANCSFAVRKALPWVWKKVVPTATITHAVEYHIVNNRTNSTSISTSYFSLNGTNTYVPPMTNSAGTKVAEITMVLGKRSDGSNVTSVATVTYPSVYLQYNSGYRWWGVLPTTTAGGQSVCSWAPWWVTPSVPTSTTTANSTRTRTVVTDLGPSPWATMAAGDFVTYTSIDHYNEIPEPDPEDPEGIWYMPERRQELEEDGIPPNIEDAAIKECFHDSYHDAGEFGGLGPKAQSSAMYLTLTETIHGDDDDTPEASIPIVVGITLDPVTSDVQTTAVGTVRPGSTIEPGQQPTQAPPTAAPVSDVPKTVDNTALPVNEGQPPPSTAPAQEALPATIVVGDATITRNSNSDLVIGTQTLRPDTPVTLQPPNEGPDNNNNNSDNDNNNNENNENDNNNNNNNPSPTTIVLQTNPSGETLLVAGSTTTTLPAAAAPPPQDNQPTPTPIIVTAGGQTLTLNPTTAGTGADNGNGNLVLPDGQTLAPGSTVTIPGAGPDGQPATIALLPGSITAAGEGQGQGASTGAPLLVVNGVTTALPAAPATVGSAEGAAGGASVTVVGGATFTLVPTTATGSDGAAAVTTAVVLPDGRTLAPGASATLLAPTGAGGAAGPTPVALVVETDEDGSTHTQLVVGSVTADLGGITAAGSATGTAAAGSAGSTATPTVLPVTPLADGDGIVVAGRTVGVGESVTLAGGTVVAVKTEGEGGAEKTVVVLGGKSVTLSGSAGASKTATAAATTTTGDGLGGDVWEGVGGTRATGTGTAAAAATSTGGGAGRRGVGGEGVLLGVVMGAVGMGWGW